jgi:hypothetical protein
MCRDQFEFCERIPEKIRGIYRRLCEDVAALQLKWSCYLDLFSSHANAALLSGTSQVCFQVIDESLRNDLIVGICRLSDPSRMLHQDSISLATLVGLCDDLPRVGHLLTAFHAACGPVRRHRNRQVVHNDFHSTIQPHENLLPDVNRSQVDQLLRLADQVLKAVYRHYSEGDSNCSLVVSGDAQDLIDWLNLAHRCAKQER